MIPPLRERGDDIILLARFYVEEFNKKFGRKVKGLSKDAELVFKAYQWPGNVRELKNIIERVMILQSIGNIIMPENLPTEIKTTEHQKQFKIDIDDFISLLSGGVDYTAVTQKIITEIKEKILQNALEISGGNKTMAAKHLSISRYKLIREQKKIGRQMN
jgi:transcriptional regulator with PAS, ATPase and Fis domain